MVELVEGCFSELLGENTVLHWRRGVFLLGSSNYGTRLKKRWVCMDICVGKGRRKGERTKVFPVR
jgi:hypothetical protein